MPDQNNGTRRQDRAGEASDWRSRYDRFGPAVCPECWGMGWMRMDVPYGHADFGKIVKCARDHADSRHINVIPYDGEAPEQRRWESNE